MAAKDVKFGSDARARMLRWLADRHGDRVLADAASRIERAVAEVLASGAGCTPDIGGSATTAEFTAAVHRNLSWLRWSDAEEERSFDWAV